MAQEYCTYSHDALDGVSQGSVEISSSSETLGAQRGKTLALHVVEKGADDGCIAIVLRSGERSQQGDGGKDVAELHDEDDVLDRKLNVGEFD